MLHPQVHPKTADLSHFPFHAAVFIHLKSLFAARFVYIFCMVHMFACAGASVCVCMCVCVHVNVLRIVSADKILHFINTLLLFNHHGCKIKNLKKRVNFLTFLPSGTKSPQIFGERASACWPWSHCTFTCVFNSTDSTGSALHSSAAMLYHCWSTATPPHSNTHQKPAGETRALSMTPAAPWLISICWWKNLTSALPNTCHHRVFVFMLNLR